MPCNDADTDEVKEGGNKKSEARVKIISKRTARVGSRIQWPQSVSYAIRGKVAKLLAAILCWIKELLHEVWPLCLNVTY
jgi:hypothetical protein